MLFTGYRTQGFFDEMFDADDSPRPIYADVTRGLSRITGRGFAARSAEVVRHFTNHGITFGHTGMEQIFPFDLVPRIIPASEWAEISAGLVQRVIALDRFLADVYGPRRCVTDGVVPNTMIAGCSGYLRAAAGVTPPGGRHVHLAGIDLVRDDQGTWRVLEDNLRNPSGISYLIHNREFMRRMFPEAFTAQRVEPVDHAALLLPDAVTAAVDTTGQRRGSWCSHPVLRTPRTRSTRSWRSRWAPSSWRGGTSLSGIAGYGCVRPRGSHPSTSSTAASTTSSSTLRPFGPTRCSACPA
jgi:uncharacterized circularly permuted ATP-grasp superfamily protein